MNLIIHNYASCSVLSRGMHCGLELDADTCKHKDWASRGLEIVVWPVTAAVV
jgi:hypothetical protein